MSAGEEYEASIQENGSRRKDDANKIKFIAKALAYIDIQSKSCKIDFKPKGRLQELIIAQFMAAGCSFSRKEQSILFKLYFVEEEMKAIYLSQAMVRVWLVVCVLAGSFSTASNNKVFAMPLSVTYNCSTKQTQIPSAQCEALVALYNSTNGAGWAVHTGWLLTNAPCSWYGVTCAGGNVTVLSLYANQLIGSLPPELANLSAITTLDLHNNQLSGSIPVELGGLTTLTALYLSGNALAGSIPTQFGTLVNLTNLDLSNNALTGSIPTQLGNLTNLMNLDLSANQLTGSIPAQLGSLSHFYWLDLSDNALSGSIPKELGNLLQLQFLYLNKNQLTGSIPVRLGSLTQLTALLLSDNKLTGTIPVELGALTNLTKLGLANNQLTGALPDEVGNLTQLDMLYLAGNQLTGEIPYSITSLTQLTLLTLSCGLTSTNTSVINFINSILGTGWDVDCPPENDDFAGARTITSPSPYSHTVSVAAATTAIDDPAFVCGSTNQGSNSVWYRYTAGGSGTLTVDTLGSGYDTMLAVWTGNRGSLVNVGCNDDTGATSQSKLAIAVSVGQTYLIEVAGYAASGTLVFNATFPQSAITPTPTGSSVPVLTPTRTPTPKPGTLTFTSNATADGWIFESSEFSNVGGKVNSTSPTLNLGDTLVNCQYRAILSFDTSALPNTATIKKITLVFKMSTGKPNQVITFQGFMADVKNGFFGTGSWLESVDFQAAASKSVGPSVLSAVSNVYRFDLSAAKDSINKLTTNGGLTQIRLRFKLDDNNDEVANTFAIFSANAPTVANRPQLVVEYVVP